MRSEEAMADARVKLAEGALLSCVMVQHVAHVAGESTGSVLANHSQRIRAAMLLALLASQGVSSDLPPSGTCGRCVEICPWEARELSNDDGLFAERTISRLSTLADLS